MSHRQIQVAAIAATLSVVLAGPPAPIGTPAPAGSDGAAAVPGVVDAGFLGWLEVPMVQRLMLHVPLGLAIAGVSLVTLVVTGTMRHWWTRAERLPYAALAVATVALIGQLSAWRLIGWGLT